ncbi:unnamed protein product [Didymodactylos carnosus]|nr:unnamed protein product [Didymodactylos carnosus]CAF4029490.1 unnamed protein product [Didymodactylos carnosus]
MLEIGLVLDVQDGKCWLRDKPLSKFLLATDLQQASRLDIPVYAVHKKRIPPFHQTFITAQTPLDISGQKWEATTTSASSRLSIANSIVTVEQNIANVMVANLTPQWSYIRPGQKLAFLDHFSSDSSLQKSDGSLQEHQDTCTFITQESPVSDPKEGQSNSSNSADNCSKDISATKCVNSPELATSLFIAERKFDNHIEKIRRRLLSQDLIARRIEHEKIKIRKDADVGEGDFGSSLSRFVNNQSTVERPDPLTALVVRSLAENTDLAHISPANPQFYSQIAEKQLETFSDSTDIPGDWLTKLDLASSGFSLNQENQLRQLLFQYSDIFSSKPDRTNIVKHHIDVGDARSIKQGPYRLL